jgi:hypothetical protein
MQFQDRSEESAIWRKCINLQFYWYIGFCRFSFITKLFLLLWSKITIFIYHHGQPINSSSYVSNNNSNSLFFFSQFVKYRIDILWKLYIIVVSIFHLIYSAILMMFHIIIIHFFFKKQNSLMTIIHFLMIQSKAHKKKINVLSYCFKLRCNNVDMLYIIVNILFWYYLLCVKIYGHSKLGHVCWNTLYTHFQTSIPRNIFRFFSKSS